MLVNDDLPTGPPDFKEHGGYYPSQLPEAKVNALEQLTINVVAALKLHGAFHFEAKVNDRLEVFPIEMNARVGGKEAPYAVEATTGWHLHTAHAQLATGQTPTRHTDPLYNIVASRNLYSNEEGFLIGIKEIDPHKVVELSLVIIRYLNQKRNYIPNRASLSCLCWLAAGGHNKKDVEDKINQAQQLIEYDFRKDSGEGSTTTTHNF